MCLKTQPPRPGAGAGRKLPRVKGPLACSLSKASVPGFSSLPRAPPGRADLIIRAVRRWPERWTGCHCCFKRAKGECPGDTKFGRQATVRCILCIYATVCLGSCQCFRSGLFCLLAPAPPPPQPHPLRPVHSFVGLAFGPLLSSAPLPSLPPTAAPPPCREFPAFSMLPDHGSLLCL